MNMDDHHHHHQYDSSMANLCRQLINGRPPISPPADMFSAQRNFSQDGQHHYEMMMMVGRQVGEMIPLNADSTVLAAAAAANTTNTTVMNSCDGGGGSASGFEAEAGYFNAGGDGGTGRWPRQETLTLLEVRSRLDSKFKEAIQKGPLWDEISRIMSEEHGYQRSGRKCREKFENLYKYYKKTKDGKSGRQDGRHYRFFRQLEALYGESSTTSNTLAASEQENQFVSKSTTHRIQSANNITSTPTNHEARQCQRQWDNSLSISTSFGFESSSSEDNDLSSSSVKENESLERRRKRRGPSKWREKIKDFIDGQMRKLIEKQEAWFEKMMKTLEQKEQERLRREEEWKKQEAARSEREHEFWAKEKAWIEARDAALMEALHRFTGRDLHAMSPYIEETIATERPHMNHSCDNQHEINGSDNNTSNEEIWSDSEITRLIELRTGMEFRIQQTGCSEEILWEEISTRIACLGYDKSSIMCKEKWDSICNDYTRRSRNENNKKRKENSRNYAYFQNDNSILYSQGGASYTEIGEQRHDITRLQINDGSSPSSCNVGHSMPDSCLRFLMENGESLWENYAFKLNKGDN